MGDAAASTRCPTARCSRCAPTTARRLIAFDVLGSGVGERVLVATGSVASNYFSPEHPPLDALIVGSLDETNGEEQ